MILPGHEYPRKFDEYVIGKLLKVEEKVTDMEINPAEQLRKITDVFKRITKTTKRKKNGPKKRTKKS